MPRQSLDDDSDDGSVEEVYNAKENKVEQMIRMFSNKNDAEIQKPNYDHDDDSRTQSSMSTLFRHGKGGMHENSRPNDYRSYQFDDDATIDSLSDVFKTPSNTSRIGSAMSPSKKHGKSRNTYTSSQKVIPRVKSNTHYSQERDNMTSIIDNVANSHDETEFTTIENDEESGRDFAPKDGSKQREGGTEDATKSSLYETPSRTRKKEEKRSISNRMICCISFTFVIATAVAVVVFFQFFYKKPGDSNGTNELDGSENNIRNPTPVAAPVNLIPTAPVNAVPTTASMPSAVQTSMPTAKPTEDYIGPMMEFLQDSQVYFERDPLSPDFMAVQFMAEEAQISARQGVSSSFGNGLELDDKFIQRFAILTLDYALNRPNISSVSLKQTRDVDFEHYKSLHTVAVKEVDECQWEGVVCADVGDEAGKVQEIRFAHSGLTGTIPPEINLLKNLKILDLAGNDIHGSIPDSLYSIKEMKELFLYKNHLTGTISNNIGNWWNITHLHLSHNELSGSIPVTFKSGTIIRPIKYLNLYSNRLTGIIPDMRFRKLVYADLGRNQLTGTLPDDIGLKWVELRHLHLDHNEFSGTIPWTYTTVGNGRVESLSFNHNKLKGWVPGYYQHHKLLELNLQNNAFTGVEYSTCEQSVFHSGEMVEFTADCDVCICDPFCEKCKDQ